jgi:hypothetical protein
MANRNVVDSSKGQLQNYLARKSFTLTKDQANACDGGSGYVLVRFKNAVLGVGYYDKSEGAVASLFPKSMARE